MQILVLCEGEGKIIANEKIQCEGEEKVATNEKNPVVGSILASNLVVSFFLPEEDFWTVFNIWELRN